MKRLFMTFATMLLVSVSAFAQSSNNNPLKGDVNGDGVVDEEDIAAVIAIIKNPAQPQKTYYYYYYAGWTLPTVSNVDTIITETYPAESGSSTMHTAGKKTTSSSSMNYSTNTLYNANQKINYYVLVPSGQTINDTEHDSALSAFTSKGTITVGNKQHTIYMSNATSRNINAIIIE